MSTTLLLNASFEPLHAISARRALVLVLADKADVVATTTEQFRSERACYPVPSVVRLRCYVRIPYRACVPLNRRNLAARDGGRCAYCGDRGSTVDHVIPRSRGGTHAWDNVVLACLPCNSRKGDRLLAELGWCLEATPRTPDAWSWLAVALGRIDPDWEPWLPTASVAVSA